MAIETKFGKKTLSLLEFTNISHEIEPYLSKIIMSLLKLLGFTLTRSCETSFLLHPKNFTFSVLDIESCLPVVYHSVHLLEFAQGKLLVKMAEKTKNTSYPDIVMSDKPFGYWKLDDLAGSKYAHNLGPTGTELMGSISSGVTKQVASSLCNIAQQSNVAFSFNVEKNSHVDFRYSDTLNPLDPNQSFTIECWVKATGGEGTKRVFICSGSFSLYISKYDNWCCSLSSAVYLTTIHLTGSKVEYNKITHVVFTYDGTMAKFYINSVLSASAYCEELYQKLTVDEEIKSKKKLQLLDQEEQNEIKKSIEEAKQIEGKRLDDPSSKQELETIAKKLIDKRNLERKRVKDRLSTQSKVSTTLVNRTTKQAAADTISSPNHINKITMLNEINNKGPTILDSVDSLSINEKLPPQLLMGEALYIAKQQILGEIEKKISDRVHEKYIKLKEEQIKENEKIKSKSSKKLKIPFCLGATSPNKNNSEYSNYFTGELCHVAFYEHLLGETQIQHHYVIGTKDKSMEVGRLYKLASDRFKVALRKVPNDKLLLDEYAKALCSHYSLDASRYEDQSEYKAKVLQSVHFFYDTKIEDGIAALLDGLPPDTLYCDIVYDGYYSLMKLNKHYYDNSIDRLGKLPEKFKLLQEDIDHKYSEVGASMIKNVVKIDPTYYGRNTNLNWVENLISPSLVTHIIHTVNQGLSLRDLELSNIPDVTIADIDTITNNLHGIEHINLSNCTNICEKSIDYISKRCKNLESLVLNNCPILNDNCVQMIANLQNLHSLSLEKCGLVTDDGIITVVNNCQLLEDLNLNNMRGITDSTLKAIGRKCSMLKSLKLEWSLQITDDGMLPFIHDLFPFYLNILDLEGCGRITDKTVIELSKTFTNLQVLNISHCSSITDEGAVYASHKLWCLTHLYLSELNSITDKSFFYNPLIDDRPLSKSNFFASLLVLDVTDCHQLTDDTIHGISDRCNQLKSIVLSGCNRLTKKSIEYLCGNESLHETLTNIDISYCLNFEDADIELLVCNFIQLQKLNITGLGKITDKAVESISDKLYSLSSLWLCHCRLITDQSLFYLSNKSWMELLDLSYCRRITDTGLNSIADSHSGLKTLNIAYCIKITEECVSKIIHRCEHLLSLDVSSCPNITLKFCKILEQIRIGVYFIIFS